MFLRPTDFEVNCDFGGLDTWFSPVALGLDSEFGVNRSFIVSLLSFVYSLVVLPKNFILIGPC